MSKRSKTEASFSVKVLGRKIPIVFAHSDQIRKDLKGSDAYGYYCDADRSITIARGLSKKVRKETIIHEMVHAMLDISGVNLMLDDVTEEQLCRVFETTYKNFKEVDKWL